MVAGLWLLSVGLLWPNLGTNYRGLPPDSARLATMLGLAVCYAVYGLVLVGAVTSRWIFQRARIAAQAARCRPFVELCCWRVLAP